MHDQTAVRTEGIAEQFHRLPKGKAEVDEGHRGLANECPGRVSAPPKKPKDDACRWASTTPGASSDAESSARICMEPHQRRGQAVAAPAAVHRPPRDLRRDPPLDRRVVSDRSARRATRRKVLARQAAC